ncbi:MAG: hypothetical protein ACR2KB_16590 [Chitinophagaceae bacterium]
MFTKGLKMMAKKYPNISNIETIASFLTRLLPKSTIVKMENTLQMNAILEKKSSQRMNDFRVK